MGKIGWLLEAIKGSAFGTKLTALKKFLLEKSKVDDLTKCALCPNMCRFACPVSIVDAKETTSPAGKARIALLLRSNHLERNSDNALPLYYCISCNVCSIWCMFGFSVAELIRPLRAQLFKEGIYPDSLKDPLENLKSHHNPFGFKIKNTNTGCGDTLFIGGCFLRKFYPNAAEKIKAVLKKLGYDVFELSEEFCCGYLAYEIGDEELFLEIARNNADKLNSTHAKTVIMACPTCVYVYRELYPKYKIKLKAKVYHTSEVIMMNIDKLEFLERREIVTIHDPSKLAVGLDKPDIIREILSRIPGLMVRLPMRYGKNTFSCGSEGLLLHWIDNELEKEINLERAKELEEESNIIITASYICKKGLEGDNRRVYDLVEYIFDSIK